VASSNIKTQWRNLFKRKWHGLYRIVKQIKNGPYILQELDGTLLTRSFAANHIKKFYPRGELEEEEGEELTQEEEDEEDEHFRIPEYEEEEVED
jgi:hypothetical protein